MGGQVLSAEERLELLEQNENDANLVIPLEILDRSPLDALYVEGFAFCILLRCSILGLLLQNVRLLAHEVLQELGQHERSPLVLLFLASQLVLYLKAVVLHVFVAALRLGELLLDALKFRFKEVD